MRFKRKNVKTDKKNFFLGKPEQLQKKYYTILHSYLCFTSSIFILFTLCIFWFDLEKCLKFEILYKYDKKVKFNESKMKFGTVLLLWLRRNIYCVLWIVM